jgi:hypothetical protein
MYTLRIDNQVYKSNYEFPITYTLDQSLDFGSISIPFLAEKDPFPMYAVVEITRDNNEIEYFLVSGDIVKISSYNPLLFSHTIQLVEYTKKLENYLISAATFTQPTDGTIRYTYFDIIDRLVKISIFETANREQAALPCVLDNSLSVLQNIKAPEFFFYNKTLRQALDEVLGTLPAITRLKRINGVDTLFVDYLDITGALINQEIFLTYDGEQNITNYSTTMVSDVTNSVRGTKGLESITYYPNSAGWAVLSIPEGVGIIDDVRSVMDLKQGIYDIVQLEVKAQVTLGAVTSIGSEKAEIEREVTVDLSRFVVNKEQYEALNGSWANGPSPGNPPDSVPDLPVGITQEEMIDQGLLNKQNAIWFEPGTNFIQGLTTDWRGTFLTPETERRRSLENAILTAIDKQSIIDEGAYNSIYRCEIGRNLDAIIASNRERWELLMFRAIFIPQERANRIETERLDLSSFPKQTSSYFKQNANLINLNAYLNKMNADLQRIGEEVYVTNAIHSSFADVLNLGDYTNEGFILLNRTLTQHKDFIEANYNFSKNYQQINEMIAVDKSNDYFALVSGDKVLDRFLIYKDYVMLSSDDPNFISTESLMTQDAKTTYLNTFISNQNPVLIESWNMIRFPNVKQYAPVAGSGMGSSLVLSSGFNHNAIAGFVTILDFLNPDSKAGYVQSPTFYAFDGELEEFDIEFYDGFTGETTDFNTEIAFARALPLVDRNDYTPLITNVGKNIGSFKVYKDPGERIKFNYQLQAIVDPNNIGQIIIGNYFHNYNGLVHTPKEELFIVFSSGFYDKGEVEQVKSGAKIFLNASKNAFNHLIINNTIPQNTNSYAICDSEGKLILAVNRVDGTLPTTIKFTFSHTRPGLQKL